MNAEGWIYNLYKYFICKYALMYYIYICVYISPFAYICAYIYMKYHVLEPILISATAIPRVLFQGERTLVLSHHPASLHPE